MDLIFFSLSYYAEAIACTMQQNISAVRQKPPFCEILLAKQFSNYAVNIRKPLRDIPVIKQLPKHKCSYEILFHEFVSILNHSHNQPRNNDRKRAAANVGVRNEFLQRFKKIALLFQNLYLLIQTTGNKKSLRDHAHNNGCIASKA